MIVIGIIRREVAREIKEKREVVKIRLILKTKRTITAGKEAPVKSLAAQTLAGYL